MVREGGDSQLQPAIDMFYQGIKHRYITPSKLKSHMKQQLLDEFGLDIEHELALDQMNLNQISELVQANDIQLDENIHQALEYLMDKPEKTVEQVLATVPNLLFGNNLKNYEDQFLAGVEDLQNLPEQKLSDYYNEDVDDPEHIIDLTLDKLSDNFKPNLSQAPT